MTLNWNHLPKEIATKLRTFHRRRQLFQFLRIQFAAFGIYAILLLAATHADRFFFLETGQRVALFWGVHGLAILFWATCMARALLKKISSTSVAYAFESVLEQDAEECFVTLDNILIQGAQSRGQAAADFLDDLVDKTRHQSEGIRARQLVRDPRLRKLIGVCAGIAVFFCLLAIPQRYEFSLMLQRLYSPRAHLPKPSFVKLHVRSDRTFVGRGNEVVIEAELNGEMPPIFAWLFSAITGSSGGCTISSVNAETDDFAFESGEKLEMNRIDRRLFISYRSNLEESFSFRVRSGDAQTLASTIKVIRQPVIHHTVLKITPPEYVGIAQEIVEDPHLTASRLAFLSGTRLTLIYHVDKPVVKTEVLANDEPQPAEWNDETLVGTLDLQLRDGVRLEITATDKHGFSNVVPARIDIAVVEDQPPIVRLASPPTQITKVPGEIVPFSADIDDDYGLDKVFLRYMRNPDQQIEHTVPRELPLEITKTDNGWSVSTLFDIGETGAVPGDVLVAQIRARDIGGNDGFSPQVQIAIVPFTRDENERQRLAALAVLKESLGFLAGIHADPEATVPAETPASIKTLAELENVSTFAGLSPESLSRMIEMEHHFTDRHRHKEDMRQLRGILDYTLCLFIGRDDTDEHRATVLNALASDIVPGLTALRRAKNITWRLFGMRYEAQRIEEQLAALHQQRPTANELKALARRTSLYLETLQDIGNDLLRLARQVDSIPEQEIGDKVAEMNIAGYYMSRGRLKAQSDAASRVKDHITELLVFTSGTFSEFLALEVQARDKLNKMYERIFSTIASEHRSPKMQQWLTKDAAMMHWDPFLYHWALFVRISLLSELEEPSRSALLQPEEPLKTAIDLAARAGTELAFRWEVDLVMTNEIPPVEKAVELAVIWSEKQAAYMHYGETAEIAVSSMPDLSADMSEAALSEFVDSLASADKTNGRDALSQYQHVLKQQATAAEKQVKLSFNRSLRALSSASTSFTDMIKLVTEAAGSEDENLLRGQVQKLLSLGTVEQDMIAWVAACGYARLGFIYQDDEARMVEKLLLRMRQLHQRHQFRLKPVLLSISKAALDTQRTTDMSLLRNDLQQLQILHEALQKRVNTLIAAFHGNGIPDEERGRQYLLLEEFKRTAQLLNDAETALAQRPDDDALTAFLERFPEAGLYHILAHGHTLQLLYDSLTDMETRLKAPAASSRAAAETWQTASGYLASMQEIVKQAGEGESQQRIAMRLQQLSARLVRIRPPTRQADDKLEATAVTRFLYDLDSILNDVHSLQRELRFMAEVLQADRTGARGGPAGIWEPQHQRSAEFSQVRTLALASEAQRRTFRAILQESESSDATAAGYAWGVLLYRMVRSELYGIGAMRSPRTEAADAGDPHLAFLEEELRNALQAADIKHYAGIVEEYLKSIRDFLRY